MNPPAPRAIHFLVGLVLTLIITGSCQSKIVIPSFTPNSPVTQEAVQALEEEITFESISKDEYALYEGKSPGLIIVSRLDEINKLQEMLSRKHREVLNGLDLAHFLAVAVLQGQKPSNMYGAEVQKVTRVGANEIRLYAHFTERDPKREAAGVMTKPYHLIRIPRDGLLGDVTFVLYEDGEELLREKHTIAPPPNEVILPRIYNSSWAP